MEKDQHPKQTIIFVYGTLKKRFPNYYILSDFIHSGEVSLLSSSATTATPYPLVVGPFAVPFLLPIPSAAGSHPVSGELISVSPRALSVLDDLEGVAVGHYERRPVVVKANDGSEIEVGAYFAHRSYAEAMWRWSGEKGLTEYTEEMALEYVKPRDRPKDIGTLGQVVRATLGLTG